MMGDGRYAMRELVTADRKNVGKAFERVNGAISAGEGGKGVQKFHALSPWGSCIGGTP
ncbi:hypothetical protein FRC12_011364, partial [Ceratobasidium sp. 428]